MYDTIPSSRPQTPLLDSINCPADIRALNEAQLPTLADELRAYLLYTVGQTGGHFGAGLGVVELTVALHYVYNTPDDRLVWDVGHQTYPHKILTGRREAMASLRQQGGISGFPKRSESDYDTFGVGHSSTSISAALGMALAARAQDDDKRAVAIIGDGAMTAGMAFEALNHAAYTKANMLVVLNDNQMSISHSEGGLASYFAKIWASKLYTSVRQGSKKVLSHIPPALELARKTEEHMKGMVAPGTLFEELGFNYIGPIDGHDLSALTYALGNIRELEGPQLLHIMTQKGKGFTPAEQDPVGYHAITKIESEKSSKESVSAPKKIKYQDIFGDWLCDMAEEDGRLVGITPAMCDGSGMGKFARQYNERYHDVAIAEQHAVTVAAGLACDGMKPVVAIYSTFLQRAYDQLIHDVALQNLDVTFGIDRAGLVGEDGPTHAGSFDLSFLRCIPNMVIAAPSDENETRQLLFTAYQHPGPAAVRYPRGTGPGAPIDDTMTSLPIGKGVVRRASTRTDKHGKVAILAFGTLLNNAIDCAEELDATLVDMRFVKPLDEALIDELAQSHGLLVTLEENCIQGGAGSAVNEYLNQQGISINCLNLGLPDRFIDHGKHGDLLRDCGLDAQGIQASIEKRLARLSE
jgi:1-deoxy-D-xylulose-5-phosphate synthase